MPTTRLATRSRSRTPESGEFPKIRGWERSMDRRAGLSSAHSDVGVVQQFSGSVRATRWRSRAVFLPPNTPPPLRGQPVDGVRLLRSTRFKLLQLELLLSSQVCSN